MIIVTEYGTRLSLASPRSECFTHSHSDEFGGGFYCTYDLIVDTYRMKAKIFGGGESCEFGIIEIIDIDPDESCQVCDAIGGYCGGGSCPPRS